MRRPLWISLACLFLCFIGWAAYQGWTYLTRRDTGEVPSLLPGEQEVAWFSPATSGDGWERLIAALKNLEKDWADVHPHLPALKISFQDAFLDETASVPQIALYFAGFEKAKLWLRWYKLSGDVQQRQWLEKLRQRGRPPLAVVGGDSSDQALTTARELKLMSLEGPGKDFNDFLANGDLKKASEELGQEGPPLERLGLVARHLKESSKQLDRIARELRQEALDYLKMHDVVKQLDPIVAELKDMVQGKGLEPLDLHDVKRTEDEIRHIATELDNLAEKMHKESGWNRPLFLVTYATVDRFDDSVTEPATDLTDANQYPKFMDVYKRKTFRFCFTNEHIAHAVLDFVQDNPQVWRSNRLDHRAVAGLAGQGHVLNCMGFLGGWQQSRPVHLSALAWYDDRYSQDLSNRMWKVFKEFFYQNDIRAALPNYRWYYINYSVGGFYQPNPSEQQAVTAYLSDAAARAGQNQLLAVPAGAQPARRFLRTLCRQAPAEIQDLVVVTGDSINFNNVYRDGDVEWNVLDMPVPLIFFSHRNPIDAAAGFRRRADLGPTSSSNQESAGFHTTGSHDLLLLRDVIEAFLLAAWDGSGWSEKPDAVQPRLQGSRWHAGRVHGLSGTGPSLFDEEGNRRPYTGEHVVWLQPVVEQGRNLPRALLSVWRIDRDLADVKTWQRVGEPIIVRYNQASD